MKISLFKDFLCLVALIITTKIANGKYKTLFDLNILSIEVK